MIDLKFNEIHQRIVLWCLPLTIGISLYYLTHTSMLWLLASIISLLIISLTLTVGYHRLFTHQSFKCNIFWHYAFAFIGICCFFSSPISWAHVHKAHHKYSDTEYDSYINNHSIWFKKRYRKINENMRLISHLIKHKFQLVAHNYSLIIFIIFAFLTFNISINFLLFAYLLPASIFFTILTLSQIYTHDDKPVNRPYLEFLLPMCGEWYHVKHHQRPYESRFGKYDLGYFFIKLIKNG